MKKFALFLPLLPFILMLGCGGGGDSGNGVSIGSTPIVTLLAATSVTEHGATLNGTVIPNGSATECWFEYGTDPALATYDNDARQSMGSGIVSLSVSYAAGNLTQGTAYYYRICAANSAGTIRSSIASFTTSSPNSPPAVATLTATSVSGTGGTLNANVTPNGMATNAWFEWGLDPTFASYSMTPTQFVGSGMTSQLISAGLTGLSTATTYHYRVGAANSSGTSRGTNLSFTTGAAPSVTTLATTSVTATGATLNGNVNPHGLETNAWFEWGPNSTLAAYSATPARSVGSGTSALLVSEALTGLSPATVYYGRIAASNGSGVAKGQIAVCYFSANVSFTPATLSGSYVTGDSAYVSVQAAVTGPISGGLYFKFVDPNNVVMPNASVTKNPDNTYIFTLSTSPNVTPGHYQGIIDVRLYQDPACTNEYPVSPASLPYDINVFAITNLTPLSKWNNAADWETYQGNAGHTGYVPVTPDPTRFSPRWSWTMPGSGTTLSPPAIANGVVYLGSSGYFAASSKLYALRESDSMLQWQYDFGGVFALNPPAVSGGNVFAATSGHADTFMWSFDAAGGTPINFKTAFQSQWEHYYAPTVDNGVVYTDGGYYGGAYAFSAADGSAKWYAGLNQYDQWTPAVDNDYLYAYIGDSCSGCANAGLNVINKADGSLLTRIADPTFNWSGWSIYGSPVVGSNGSVISLNGRGPNGSGNRLINFNIGSRSVNWNVAGNYPFNPALANGVIYIANRSPYRLEARRESDGVLLWSWTPSRAGETDFAGNVVATNNLVFVSTNLRVYAIDLVGHVPAWSWNRPGQLAISANGVLYITSSDGIHLIAVNLQ